MEVTLKSPNNYVKENVIDDISNPSENVMDDLSNPSANADRVITCIVNTSAEYEQKCSTASNQEYAIGINATVNHSVSNCNQSDRKHFGNTPLINMAQPIQNSSHDQEEHKIDEGGLPEEQNNRSLNSGFPVIDKVHAVSEIGDSNGEDDTECFNKKILEENKVKMNSASAVIGNSTVSHEGDLINSSSEDSDPTCENPGAERNSLEQDSEGNGNKSSKHDRNVFVRESTDGKIKHSEVKQQSSEIKDRVMSFLTKYSNVEEASCCNVTPDSSFLKKECLKIKQIHVLNTDDNASDVPAREQIDSLKLKKKNDCSISDVNSPVTNSMTPKLRFVAESKKQGTRCLSQSWHFELPVQNSPVNFTRAKIEENNNKKDGFESNTKDLFQTKFNFPGSHTRQAPPSENTSENEPRPSCCVKENSDAVDTHESKTDSPQRKCDSDLNMLVPTKLQEDPQFNSDSYFLNQSCYLNSDSRYENAKEIGLKTSGNKMCVSENIPHSFFFNSPCSYNSKHSLQRSNTDNAVQSLISPWEKMSFQPQTTPSINSPILSSKSNDDNHSTKCTGFSGSKPHIFHSDNEDSEMPAWSSKFGHSSRRTKSSEAVYCNGLVPLSGGEAYNFNVTNDHNVDESVFETSRDGAGAYCSKFSVINGESASYMCNFSRNNSNGSFHHIFPVNHAKQSNDNKLLFSNRENLASDSIYNGSPLPKDPFKVNSNNPFAKKLPVESIGLFESPFKTTVCGAVNSNFKSVSQSNPKSVPLQFISPTKGKIHSETPDFCMVEDKSNELSKNVFKGPLQFLFQPKLGNVSEHNEQESSEFASNVCKEESSVCQGKLKTNCGQVLSDESHEQSEFLKSDELSSASSSKAVPFQFTLSPQTRKERHCYRASFPRIRVSVKTLNFHEKGFSNYVMDMKNNSNIIEKGIGVPFKPSYGSDIKVDGGINKNVFVRYQNIVLMKEFLKVSPEELRFQFYTKMASEPFKFSASLESGYKKTVTQESQTDEDLTCKGRDMSGIWRVLECPVCLDVVLPPVYQCEQGHHVCSACWKKVVTCPLCKRRKSNTRNYMAEALIEQVPLPCRYHIEGCKESVQQGNKVSHEETCLFRTYQCPVPMCNQAHCYQNMCKHFKKLHKTLLHHEGHSVIKGEKFCDVLYKESLSLSLVHAFDISKWGLFFLREVNVQRSTALFVQVMPAAPDQAAYFYHLEVSDHHDCRKESYKGRVFPIAKLTQEVVSQEEYLYLSELLLKTVKKTTPLKIVVTIWQLKPAFTISTE